MSPGGWWRRAGHSGLRAYLLAGLLLIPVLAGHGPIGMVLESGGPGGLLGLLSTPIGKAGQATSAPAAAPGLGQVLAQKAGQAAEALLSGKTRSLAVWGYFHTTPLYFFLVVLAGLLVLNFAPAAGRAPGGPWAWLAALALGGYAAFQLYALWARARPGMGAGLGLALLAACLWLGARLALRARGQGRLLWAVLLLSALASLGAVLLATQFRVTSGDYFRQPLAWANHLILALALVRLTGRPGPQTWLGSALILGLWAAVVMDGWVSYIFWAGYMPFQGKQLGMMFNAK